MTNTKQSGCKCICDIPSRGLGWQIILTDQGHYKPDSIMEIKDQRQTSAIIYVSYSNGAYQQYAQMYKMNQKYAYKIVFDVTHATSTPNFYNSKM